MDKNSLYEARSNGLGTLKSMVAARLFRQLFALSGRHIAERRRQLVVFSFDFIAHHINIDGVFERGELETFFGWLSKYPEAFNGIAIDVGANIGNHSLYFSDRYRWVHAFEPNPCTFQVLKLNADLVGNVSCYDFGISESARNAQLNVYPDNIGHSDISSVETAQGISVRLKTLDGAIPADDRVRLIKYDVEGHECQAIRGSLATIARDKPVILFEQLAGEMKNGTSDAIELLKGCGYRQFASVRKRTTRLSSRTSLIDKLVAPLNRLPIAKAFLFGTTWSVRIQQRFEGVDYPFIVAIPDWLGGSS